MAGAGALSTALCLLRVWTLTWHQQQLDLAVYLLGARHLVDGRLYLVSLGTSPHLPFTYPPFAALFFLPLAAVPTTAAQLLWALVSVLSLLAMVALSLRAVVPGMDRTRLALVSLAGLGPAILLEPVWLTFSYGQINLLLGAAILADLTMDLRLGGRTLPRGLLLGLCAAIKLIPLVFIPYLFLTRQIRAAWTALATFLGATAVAAVVQPAVTWSYFTKYATDAQRVGTVYFISNQSLRGAADRLTHHVVSGGIVTALAGLVLIAGLLVARWAFRESSAFLGLLVCATTGLLVSPITWEHHLVWLVPVVIWLLLATDRPPAGPVWALGLWGLLVWAPVLHVPFGGTSELHEHGWQVVAGSSFFFVLVGVLVGLTVMLGRRHRWRDRRPQGSLAGGTPE